MQFLRFPANADFLPTALKTGSTSVLKWLEDRLLLTSVFT